MLRKIIFGLALVVGVAPLHAMQTPKKIINVIGNCKKIFESTKKNDVGFNTTKPFLHTTQTRNYFKKHNLNHSDPIKDQMRSINHYLNLSYPAVPKNASSNWKYLWITTQHGIEEFIYRYIDLHIKNESDKDQPLHKLIDFELGNFLVGLQLEEKSNNKHILETTVSAGCEFSIRFGFVIDFSKYTLQIAFWLVDCTKFMKNNTTTSSFIFQADPGSKLNDAILKKIFLGRN